jgi:hypothetical protein
MGLTVKGMVFYIKIFLLLIPTYMHWEHLVGQRLSFPSPQGKGSLEGGKI